MTAAKHKAKRHPFQRARTDDILCNGKPAKLLRDGRPSMSLFRSQGKGRCYCSVCFERAGASQHTTVNGKSLNT